MITADLPLAVLLFLAFVLWWTGYARQLVSVGRWLAIGVVLALAGLLKGPQPIGYFVLGVGLFVIGTRSWWQIPGLLLAGLICAVPLVVWYALTYNTAPRSDLAAPLCGSRSRARLFLGRSGRVSRAIARRRRRRSSPRRF